MQKNLKIYLRIKGKAIGPFGVDDVKNLIASGEFTADDYIRMENQEIWVKAVYMKNLNALFKARENKRVEQAFGNWLGDIKSGKPAEITKTGAALERERIKNELDELEKERRELELEEQAMKATDKLRESELDRLNSERERIDDEKERLDQQSAELTTMTLSIRRRRMIPIFISIVSVIVILLAFVPAYYYGFYLPGEEKKAITEELTRQQEKYDKLIQEMEKKHSELESDELLLEAARSEGREDDATKIEERIYETQLEIEKLQLEIRKETTAGLPTNPPTNPHIEGLLEHVGENKGKCSRSFEEVNAILITTFTEILEQYELEMETTPELEGTIVLTFTIDEDGLVHDMNITAPDFDVSAPELNERVVSEIGNLNFGKSRGDFNASYVMEFKRD